MSGFLARVPIRWVDLDAQGHVNNALVADYLQEARVAFLLSGPNAHLLGTSTVVVAHQVEFLRPVVFRTQPVEVEVWVGHVGASRFTLGYEMRQDGLAVARAHTTMCIFDFGAGLPRRMTADERAWFAEVSTEVEPFRSLGRWHIGDAAHVQPFTVRWSDIDIYGHVNNVRVFDYVAEARVRMSPAADGRTRMEDAAAEDLLWMVARQDVEYVNQITHRVQPYQVRSAIARVGRTSMTIVAQVEDPLLDNRLLARTRSVLVSGDASGRPVPLPPAMRDAALRWPALPH